MNSMKDDLVLATKKAFLAAGSADAREKGEAKAAALAEGVLIAAPKI